jgi:hypothetical protein
MDVNLPFSDAAVRGSFYTFALEATIGSHTFALFEGSMRVTNSMPLGNPLLLRFSQ